MMKQGTPSTCHPIDTLKSKQKWAESTFPQLWKTEVYNNQERKDSNLKPVGKLCGSWLTLSHPLPLLGGGLGKSRIPSEEPWSLALEDAELC